MASRIRAREGVLAVDGNMTAYEGMAAEFTQGMHFYSFMASGGILCYLKRCGFTSILSPSQVSQGLSGIALSAGY